MSKKVLIVAGSPRKNGNSDLLAQQFAKGSQEEGHEVETVYLREYKLNYCLGCQTCGKTGVCVQKDRMSEIIPKMQAADVIVLASPVYFYSVSGQMKVFLDRTVPLFGRMEGKVLYYLATGQDNRHEQLDRAFDAMQGWADCFDKMTVKGRVYGCSANLRGEVKNNPAFLEAYEMGKKIE